MTYRFPTQPAGPPFAGDQAHLAAVSAAAFTPPAKSSFPVGGLLLSLVSNLENFEAGWITAYGWFLDATTYPDLAARLGIGAASYWGAAPAGQVTLPDLRDKFPLMAGATFPAKAAGGEVNHVLTIAEMPAHDHPPAGSLFVDATGGASANITTGGGGYTSRVLTGTRGGGGGHNNMPPYVAITPYVRILP